MIGKTCKSTAIMVFILDIIVAISLGTTYKLPGANYYAQPMFNWIVFISCLSIGFIFCIILYALGEIVDLLKYIGEKQNATYCHIAGLSHKMDKTNNSIRIAPSSKNRDWVCGKCGKKNSNSAISCIDCGTYK